MVPETTRGFLLVILMAGMTSCLSAKGQEPFPVFLEFDFGRVGPLKDNPEAPKNELKIAKCAIDCFKEPAHQEYFPWNMRVGAAESFPKIRIVLVEDPHFTKWALCIEGYKENGALTDKVLPLQRIVTEPGDLELRRGKLRTPLNNEFPGKVSEWLKLRFLSPELRPELQRLIMAVAPLGDCLVLAHKELPKCVDDAEGVLQLDLERIQYLYKSTFTVVCEACDKSQIELGSVGGETPAEYELSGRKKLGLSLKHKTWNDKDIHSYLSRLVHLCKGRVYLERFRAPRTATGQSHACNRSMRGARW